MPTYIALLKWTPQGLQGVKESPTRLDAARKSFEAAGVKMKDFYMVTGRYDMIAICEAPVEGALARALLSVTSKGSITSETCRAFTEQEYREIIGALAWIRLGSLPPKTQKSSCLRQHVLRSPPDKHMAEDDFANALKRRRQISITVTGRTVKEKPEQPRAGYEYKRNSAPNPEV